jgi:DNA-binding MarR family transcriptional regulator
MPMPDVELVLMTAVTVRRHLTNATAIHKIPMVLVKPLSYQTLLSRAFSNPQRMAIVRHLMRAGQSEIGIVDLAKCFGMHPGLLRYHLTVLETANLAEQIAVREDGTGHESVGK